MAAPSWICCGPAFHGHYEHAKRGRAKLN
jgi:hypothetical protein